MTEAFEDLVDELLDAVWARDDLRYHAAAAELLRLVPAEKRAALSDAVTDAGWLRWLARARLFVSEVRALLPTGWAARACPRLR